MRVPPVLVALLAGATLAACGRTPHEAALRWEAPAPLGAEGGGAAAFAVAPSGGALGRSLGGDGRVTAAWVAGEAGGTAGRLVVRPDVHASATVELRDPAGALTAYGETPPKLAYAPDGTLYAAYLLSRPVPGRKWPAKTLRLASSRDGGAHWDPPRTVRGEAADGGSTSDHALHVAPDGTLYLTWLAVTGSGGGHAQAAHGAGGHGVGGHASHTFVARSADRGATWSAPAVVDPGPSCPCCRTAVTSGPDGALYAAWRKIFPVAAGDSGRAGGPAPGQPDQVRDVVVARSGDGGRTWGAPVRVHADGWRVDFCPDAGPSVRAGADGVVHVAWWTGVEGAAGVQYARSADGGRTWGAPVALGVAAHSRAAHVQLAVAGAGDTAAVVAAWEDGTRAVAPAVVRVSRDGGRTFAPAQVLSAPGMQAGYPVVVLRTRALGGGRVPEVRVAWQERPAAGDAAGGGAAGAWRVVTRAAVLGPRAAGTMVAGTAAGTGARDVASR